VRGARVLSGAALAALGAWLMPARARAQSVVVGPVPSAMTAFPGSTITIPVVADLTSSGGASLGSIAARLTWKSATLAYVSAGGGTLGAPTINKDSASAGILKFAVANPSGATGMPVLLSLTFSVTGAPADTTVFGLSVTEITAAGTFANLKPITTATGARFCTSTGLWGDVDGDGLFTGHDALIILTYAVGLPTVPYSVVNGDVDASGTVDTRDALIVLSAAVGINVSQFRIGRINAGVCALRSAASVQIQPRNPTVAPGDSLPVTATVRDSTGALVQGIGLVWASKDATVARVGVAGNVVAVAPGSTYATVFVQPGVKDSVPVTVSGTRHVWYVNPALAAGNAGVELGSQLYPFSAIHSAIVAAAALDTVRVAVADYGERVRITKPLVLLGDSTAAGFPRVSYATGPALSIDSVASGGVWIQRLRLLASAGGLMAHATPVLSLTGVSVEGSHGPGIVVRGVDRTLLTRTQVVGATRRGIELDTVRVAQLSLVRSDVITALPGDTAYTIRVIGSDTVTADSVTVGTAGIRVDSANTLSLRRTRAAGANGNLLFAYGATIAVVAGDFSGAALGSGTPYSAVPGFYAVALHATVAGRVRLDSTRIHDNGLFGLYMAGGASDSLRGDSLARNYSQLNYAGSYLTSFSSLKIATCQFVANGLGYLELYGKVGNTVTVDTSVFDASNVLVSGGAAFTMHGGIVRNGIGGQLSVEGVTTATLVSVEASGVVTGSYVYTLALPAIYLYSVDSLLATGLSAHDNQGGALGAFFSRSVTVLGGTLVHNGFGTSFPSYVTRATMASYSVAKTLIRNTTVTDTADVGVIVYGNTASGTVVDSSALEGSRYLVVAGYGCCTAYNDSLRVSNSRLTGFHGTSLAGVQGFYLGRLTVTQNLLDSLALNGVQAVGVTATTASGNQFRAYGDTGISVATGYGTVSGNTFTACEPWRVAVHSHQANPYIQVTGNTLTGCEAFFQADNFLGTLHPTLEVRGNVVVRDTTTSGPAVSAFGQLGAVRVVGDSIVGGISGVLVDGQGYAVDSVRVDSNTVRLTRGDGVAFGRITGPVSLTYNRISGNRGRGLFSKTKFTALNNTVAFNLAVGVKDSSTGPSSFRRGNIVGNLPSGLLTASPSMGADSNWWGSPNGATCSFQKIGCAVIGGGDILADSITTVATPLGAASGTAPAMPSMPGVVVARPSLAGIAVPPSPATLNVGTDRTRMLRGAVAAEPPLSRKLRVVP
jgi:hypothetical protein